MTAAWTLAAETSAGSGVPAEMTAALANMLEAALAAAAGPGAGRAGTAPAARGWCRR